MKVNYFMTCKKSAIVSGNPWLIIIFTLCIYSLNADFIIKNNSKIKAQSSDNGLLYDPDGDGVHNIKIDVGGNLLIGDKFVEGGVTGKGGLHVEGDARFSGNVILGGDSIDDGLVGWWTFDQADAGGNIVDHSGQNNHGAVTNTTFAADSTIGVFGKAMNFDGSNDYVNMPAPTGVPSGSDERTVTFWMYQHTRTNGVNSAIVALDSDSSAQVFSVQMSTVGGVTYLFTDAANAPNNITLSGGEIPSLNAWQHVVLSKDENDNWVYYLNGVEIKSGTFATAINTDLDNITIGRRDDGGATGYYDGLVDDVRIYKRTLNAKEVAELYRGKSAYLSQGGTVSGNLSITGNAYVGGLINFETLGSAPSSASAGDLYSDGGNLFFYDGSGWKDTTLKGNSKWPEEAGDITNGGGVTGDNLMGWWTLEDTSGSTAYDSSIKANHGTITNMAAGNIGVDGAKGRAFEFDGSDDYVNIPTNSDFEMDYITVTAWINSNDVTAIHQIFSKDNSGGDRAWQLRSDASGKIEFLCHNQSTNAFAESSTSISTGGWVHVAGTWDGSTIRVYINGSEAGTAVLSGTLKNGQTSHNAMIGRSENASPDYFDGKIDDVRLYNRALTASEVVNIYNSTVQIKVGSTNSRGAFLGIDNASGTNDIFSVRDNGSEVMVVKDGGLIGIGTSSPTYNLDVSGNVKIDGDLLITGALNFSGNILVNTTHSYDLGSDSLAFDEITSKKIVTTSDKRLKAGIKELDIGLEEVLKLKPKKYRFKSNNKKQIGLIAQEVQEVIPEAVKEGDTLSVRYFDLVPVLIQSQKEDRAEMIKDLKELLELIKKEKEKNQKLREQLSE